MKRLSRLMRLVCCLTLCALATDGRVRPAGAAPDDPPSAGAVASPAGAPPFFQGLGSYSRKVTTKSAEARRYFDQGLNFVYGFNHDQSRCAFEYAATLDPTCAMAWWGVALANGPHINNPMVDEAHAKAAWNAVQKASALAATGTETERALITALQARYADPQPADRHPLDQAYADAMREVWRNHPRDADVGALFAESMMDLRPWDLWMLDGTPQPGTQEIVATLEEVLSFAPKHPLANHLYIHAVEASPHPERGLVPADRLRDLQPGLGHMVHMPSHIDVRTGRWQEAITANQKAIEADRKYREIVPRQGFYNVYMAHNQHMLSYASMMVGESEQAIAAIRRMVAGIPEDWLRENAWFADGFMAMPFEVLMRFGRWDQILAEPEPADYLPISRALRHYARGVAYAAKGDVPNARVEEAAFLAGRKALPADAIFGNNSASMLLDVAQHMLAGEILYRENKVDAALDELRASVAREDSLRYDEPPDWIQPTRHALGATLLQVGRFPEAEAVYREDLRRLPDNGWSLYGLWRSLAVQDKKDEATKVKTKYDKVWSKADIKLSSSCFCQPGV